jgi:hypothetical protein
VVSCSSSGEKCTRTASFMRMEVRATRRRLRAKKARDVFLARERRLGLSTGDRLELAVRSTPVLAESRPGKVPRAGAGRCRRGARH